MIRVRFLGPDGETEAVGEEGTTLLKAGQAANQPLEGTCEGQMACSTCHVIVRPDDFDRLPPASEEEEDMLDMATAATRTSRLACQIVLTRALDGLTVAVPPSAGNARAW